MDGTARHCETCGYDLRGGPFSPGRCSECGQALTAAALAAARERCLLRRLGRAAIVAGLVAAAAGPALAVATRDHAIFVLPALVLLVAPLAPALVAAWVNRQLGDDDPDTPTPRT